ncbi:hypothetical protein [Microbulbifer sp. ZKSA002]|uniref:hypothetical protein n=1 Tax=Microbulbifer sp. ZKSA002 TaxID=3243388 RepID=UPI00403A0174
MAKSAMIGMINCALCGNDQATVHEQRTGSKKGRLYYRCYESAGSNTMRCGTIQCLGPNGQQYIQSNIRPIGQTGQESAPIGQTPASNEPAPPSDSPQRPIGEQQPEPKKRGWLAGLLAEDDDD